MFSLRDCVIIIYIYEVLNDKQFTCIYSDGTARWLGCIAPHMTVMLQVSRPPTSKFSDDVNHVVGIVAPNSTESAPLLRQSRYDAERNSYNETMRHYIRFKMLILLMANTAIILEHRFPITILSIVSQTGRYILALVR